MGKIVVPPAEQAKRMAIRKRMHQELMAMRRACNDKIFDEDFGNILETVAGVLARKIQFNNSDHIAKLGLLCEKFCDARIEEMKRAGEWVDDPENSKSGQKTTVISTQN